MRTRTRNAELDPQVDYHRIYRDLTTLEFPWDFNQALSFALFRTYAVPSIGDLLHRTREFEERTQKRYDDTALLLEVPLLHGFEDERGRSAVRRINQMHRMYDISDADMLYVLSTFVVVPKRWIDDFGWRRLTDSEVAASVLYYRDLGRHMAIQEIPETYEGFAALMDSYEAEHFGYSEGARRVADATMALLASFYPAPLRPAIDVFSRSIMDDPLLRAFRYRKPGRLARAVSVAGLKARALLVSRLPARRTPLHVYEMARIKSYPGGFSVPALGTFAPGCPVDHRALAVEEDPAGR
ncbi:MULTISPECIES: oxygenase MpaB family protein [Tsukamurella]|uniref:Oxygenase MpaB family protein n=1 Tax=Tsukamurella strandjordii TaxID=147577 RepID=A0AA90NB95_9ACTN|nr:MULTISPECIES: oxygenase MpaB family protein [Tsukamurella]MDP0397272.1 oxygenase MpaB family protein [Tsukamurella strandjordii]GIZ98695.1 peptidase [Tsukamurella sp. TY48]